MGRLFISWPGLYRPSTFRCDVLSEVKIRDAGRKSDGPSDSEFLVWFASHLHHAHFSDDPKDVEAGDYLGEYALRAFCGQ